MSEVSAINQGYLIVMLEKIKSSCIINLYSSVLRLTNPFLHPWEIYPLKDFFDLELIVNGNDPEKLRSNVEH